jgi:hypothetical protein
MSDHFTGPRALAGPAGDITDVDAFAGTERPGHLVMVIDALPATKPGADFPEAIGCRFKPRPVAIAGTTTSHYLAAPYPDLPEDVAAPSLPEVPS